MAAIDAATAWGNIFIDQVSAHSNSGSNHRKYHLESFQRLKAVRLLCGYEKPSLRHASDLACLQCLLPLHPSITCTRASNGGSMLAQAFPFVERKRLSRLPVGFFDNLADLQLKPSW
jgi:hypothetical protein